MADCSVTMGAPALELLGVSFSYAGDGGTLAEVLDGASMAVEEGAFALLVGSTGSGKTTLLRLAKPELAPVGELAGSVRVFGRDARTLSVGESAELVGYVFQSPENQIVCDTVWHELAFGMESLGMGQAQMRRRMSEVCLFLGIEPWFRRRCAELSGGQRQVVALAAVLAMRPRLLLLDEPTSMLDPVAEREFCSLLFRANRELGVTVVVATHDPSAMADYATCAFELWDGCVCPADLHKLGKRADLGQMPAQRAQVVPQERALVVRDAWLRYDRTDDWVLRGCDLVLGRGESRALVGGNGSGKSTLLQVAAGGLRLRHGSAKVGNGLTKALLPQNPKALLGCETVVEELFEWGPSGGYGTTEVDEALDRLGLQDRRDIHPYDLSGGQQQLLALEKLLLLRPDVLLLDEPTKGLDLTCRRAMTERLRALVEQGMTMLVATHDMAFVRGVTHTVSLLFDGQAGGAEPTSEFLEQSWMWRA